MDEATPPTPPAPAGSSPPKGLVERITGILFSPKTEWGVIEGEASTVQSIYVPYVLILAAIGPLAGLLGQQLIGINFAGFSYKPPIAASLTGAVLSYVLTLGAVYLAAFIIDALAPTFKGQKNFLNAFKVAAYAWTPGWLAGIFGIVPALALIAFLGVLYGFYLLYLGLPRLMKVKEDQALGYVGVVIFIQFVIMAILFIVVGQVVAAMYTPTTMVAPNAIIVG